MSDGASLSGKTAIVTGGSRGIGRAIALRLATAGCNVLVTSRSVEQLEEVQKSVGPRRGKVQAVAADLSQKECGEKIAGAARAAFGGIDYLVNNAGQAAIGTIAQLGAGDFERMIDVNIRGMFACCKAVWNDLATRRGAIINISSAAAFDPFPGLGAYGATKVFINLYTRVLADEGSGQGIRAYAIAPGAVETEMLRGAFPDYPSAQTLSPEDVAELAVTLLSPACRYSSGEVIRIQKR